MQDICQKCKGKGEIYVESFNKNGSVQSFAHTPCPECFSRTHQSVFSQWVKTPYPKPFKTEEKS